MDLIVGAPGLVGGLAALEVQHRSPDPLQQTFAALMIACALGDPIPEARPNAERYGVRLRSVGDFASTCASPG